MATRLKINQAYCVDHKQILSRSRKNPLITEKHLLDKYTNSHMVAPNAYQDEVESIPLPPGNYWIKATLVFD